MMKNERKYHLDYFYEKEQEEKPFIPAPPITIKCDDVSADEFEKASQDFFKALNELREKAKAERKKYFVGLPEYEEITYCFSDIETGAKIMRLVDALLTFIIDTTDVKKQDLTTTLMDLGFSFREVNKVKQAIDDLTFNGPEYKLKKNFDFLYEPYMKVAKYERFVLYLYEQYPNINYVYKKDYPFGYMY
jgi:hypothetical protein